MSSSPSGRLAGKVVMQGLHPAQDFPLNVRRADHRCWPAFVSARDRPSATRFFKGNARALPGVVLSVFGIAVRDRSAVVLHGHRQRWRDIHGGPLVKNGDITR